MASSTNVTVLNKSPHERIDGLVRQVLELSAKRTQLEHMIAAERRWRDEVASTIDRRMQELNRLRPAQCSVYGFGHLLEVTREGSISVREVENLDVLKHEDPS